MGEQALDLRAIKALTPGAGEVVRSRYLAEISAFARLLTVA
jgi:hypothetical protein